MDSLNSNIEKTLAWFALFNYPLTITELWQWLWSPSNTVSYQDIYHLVQSGQINAVSPFVVLTGREDDIETRAQRYLFAVRKQRKARRVTWWLSWLPWVEGVALCNSLGYQNARDESDIDFFIITKPNTIWLTRLIAVAFLKLLGQRPSIEHGRDTLCLSFYVTSDNLNLDYIALTNGDPYLTYWVVQLSPLFGRGAIWKRFFEENKWVASILPNTMGYAENQTNWYYRSGREAKSVGSLVIKLDKFSKDLQIKKFSKILYEQANLSGGNVIMTDQMLKLHTKDRRLFYRDAWQKKHEEV